MLLLIKLIFFLCTLRISLCDDEAGSVTTETPQYETPVLNDRSVYFYEHFDDSSIFNTKWIKSQAKKKQSDGDAEYDGAWEIEAPFGTALPHDFGLVLKNKAKHSAVSAFLKRPFKFDSNPLIVQYEVLFQNGQECGGAYIKLLSDHEDNKNLSQFNDISPYTIMFGPDKCGNDLKLHFIFKHKNPITGEFEEKHCKKPDVKLDKFFNDQIPHLYTLVLYPDNTYNILIDHNVVNKGSLFVDFTPEVNPPAEIDDPTDVRPADWDFREKIPDPTAKKPEDWDESAPSTIPDSTATKPEGWLDDEPVDIKDPEAEKPSDWDEEMDGVWEAPLIPNPACQDIPGCGKWSPPQIENPDYKGKWVAPLIDNPNYKGEWKPRRIPNPNYFEDKNPFKMSTVVAVGFELWSMSPNILFDNILITDSDKIVNEVAAKTFDLKKKLYEKNEEDGFFSQIVNYTNQKPWLWAVYIVLLLIPVVLAVLFCFGVTSKDKDSDKDALRKKTDAPEADDDQASDEPASAEPNNKEDEDLADDQLPSEDVDSSSDKMDEDKEDSGDEKTLSKKSPHRRRIRAD